MTNLTKTIAALGVVAGLGVAALPLSGAHAEAIKWYPSTDETNYKAANMGVDKDGNNYVNTDKVDVELTIEDLLSIEADATKVTLTSTDGTDYTHTTPLGITVITKNSKGYNLSIKGSAATNPTSMANPTGDQIKAAAGTFAAPKALDITANSEWGYTIEGMKIADSETAGYAGVTADGEVVKTTEEATVNKGETTNFTFAAKIKDGQAAGTYTGQVTFTATNNPNTAAEEGEENS